MHVSSAKKNPTSPRGAEAMNYKEEINQCSCGRERERGELLHPTPALAEIISKQIYFLINVQRQV